MSQMTFAVLDATRAISERLHSIFLDTLIRDLLAETIAGHLVAATDETQPDDPCPINRLVHIALRWFPRASTCT